MKLQIAKKKKTMNNIENIKIGIVSLGCAKNLVDTEAMLGVLSESGAEITANPQEADVIIVNTCGFIESAKEESINTVLEMAEFKKDRCKLLIMCGCLAERYNEEVLKELPEVDAVCGTGDYLKIAEVIKRAMSGEKVCLFGNSSDPIAAIEKRIISTGDKTAYIKIADGCDNHCTYCVIPKLRGKYRSRPMEAILDEARDLAESGISELIVIAQDTTRYGMDLYGKYRLAELLKKLAGISGLRWIRVHYMYPEVISDDLIKVFATEEKIVKYMDIPIQHASSAVLKRMGRHTTGEEIYALIKKLRENIPGITLRTSLIAGFPGETEEDFLELLEFVKKVRFEKLGVFAYSKEEDTPAAMLPDQIDEEVKASRRDAIMEIQAEISEEINKEKIGKVITVLCEGYDMENLMYYGRSEGDSVDVDNLVYFASEDETEIGEFVNVLVLDASQYDLTGRRIFDEG